MIQQNDPRLWRAFHIDPVRCRPQGAEDLQLFGRRVARAMQNLLELEAARILVVAHAGVIRAALGHVMQSPPDAWYRVAVDHAGLTRFQYTDQGWKLVFHNRSGLTASGDNQ